MVYKFEHRDIIISKIVRELLAFIATNMSTHTHYVIVKVCKIPRSNTMNWSCWLEWSCYVICLDQIKGMSLNGLLGAQITTYRRIRDVYSKWVDIRSVKVCTRVLYLKPLSHQAALPLRCKALLFFPERREIAWKQMFFLKKTIARRSHVDLGVSTELNDIPTAF